MRIKFEEAEIDRLDGGGVPIIFFQGKPFTGIVYETEADGSIAWEEEYINSYQEGWTRSFHPNGKLAQEYKSHNNKIIENTYKEWDEAGNLINSF
jgi:antitoxin component YwqK of YwqJK toxin-antitoxin module